MPEPRYGELVHRAGWEQEERRRIEQALAEGRKWQQVEPHKVDFWTTFDETLEVHYPTWKWRRQPQTGLAEFAGGDA
jgi:hypothetical protein